MNLVPQIMFVVLGIGAIVAVIVTLPDGPRISRPRICGHRQGPWVCVADRHHPESGHYYRKVAR